MAAKDESEKVLAACSKCQTQYDVTGQKPGGNVHCRCGAVITVPKRELHDARMVRCASCGAVRGQAGENCDFCGARFSAIDKGWGSMCPGCFCRLPNDARFCVECGLRISPQKLDLSRADQSCPRCAIALQGRIFDKLELFECASCAGVWLPVAMFETICKDKESRSVAAKELTASGRSTRFELTESEKVKYVPCPACKSLMNRKNFGRVSGIIIDTCRNCGVWLDNNELNRIVQFIESGGLNETREFEAREREERVRSTTPAMPMDVHMRPINTSSSSSAAPILIRIAAEIAFAFFK